MEELRILSGDNDLYATNKPKSVTISVTENDIQHHSIDFAQIVLTKDQARQLGEWLIKSSEEQ